MPGIASGRRAALLRRIAPLLGGAILAVGGNALTASAHAVTHNGPYTAAIGWAAEPAYVGFDNAVEVIVSDQAGKPVGDLQPGDLKVVVSIGSSRSQSLDLTPTFDPDTGLGTPGDYEAQLIPTVPGAYTFHVTGSVHGQAVDQSITASDQTFAVVTEPSDDQFPTKLPSTSSLSTKLDQTAARLAAAQKSASDASGSATIALVIGIVALVVGVALGAVSLLAMRRRRV